MRYRAGSRVVVERSQRSKFGIVERVVARKPD
jgi:hypothetical protein